ncbi:MAG: glycosylase [Candidatus Hydrogenedentes bacterium]|nr:glycosylase [Candidatus Hydrogenedentota bacterium]
MLLSLSVAVSLFMAAAEPPLPFPSELVDFVPYGHNPLFEGSGPGHWDEAIRERGWIMKEGDTYTMWYTGYVPGKAPVMKLGLATSTDGYTWKRYSDAPIYDRTWVEDMIVVKQGDTYYMFAEGTNDHAHLLTSTDRVQWTDRGTLDIRYADGSPLKPGPFGTPCVLFENEVWYLFYERDDEAIWVATSKDLKTWKNIQDEPVIKRGPEPYDTKMIALNQIVKYDDCYYAYYHATAPANGPDKWTMNVAASKDLIHWQKYPGNPIIGVDNSSGILVNDGQRYRMYCMHREVSLFLPRKNASGK